MIRLRWRILLTPACWVRGHRKEFVETVPMGWDYWRCRRCLRRWPLVDRAELEDAVMAHWFHRARKRRKANG